MCLYTVRMSLAQTARCQHNDDSWIRSRRGWQGLRFWINFRCYTVIHLEEQRETTRNLLGQTILGHGAFQIWSMGATLYGHVQYPSVMPIKNPLMSGLGIVVNQYFRFEFKITEYRMSPRCTSSLFTLNLKTKKRYSASVEVLIVASFWDVTLLCSNDHSTFIFSARKNSLVGEIKRLIQLRVMRADTPFLDCCTLKMKALRSFETSGTTCSATQRQIRPESPKEAHT